MSSEDQCCVATNMDDGLSDLRRIYWACLDSYVSAASRNPPERNLTPRVGGDDECGILGVLSTRKVRV